MPADPPARASPRQNSCCACEASVPLAGVASRDGVSEAENPPASFNRRWGVTNGKARDEWRGCWNCYLCKCWNLGSKESGFYVPINGVWGKGDNCTACFPDLSSHSLCCCLSCSLDPRMAPKHCFSFLAGSNFHSGACSYLWSQADDFLNRGQLELQCLSSP